MNPEQQLQYEARVRNRQAVVAVLAGILLVVASALQLAGPHTKVDELTIDLITANKRFPLDLIAAVINGLGSLLVAWTLNYLYVCSRARNDRGQAVHQDRRDRRRRPVGDRRGRVRDRRRDQGARVRHHRRADLRRGQPPDERHRPARAPACRPGGGAAAGGGHRARFAERDAPGAADPLHGLPGDLRRRARACSRSRRSRSSRASGWSRSLPDLGTLADRAAPGVALGPRGAVAVVVGDARAADGAAGRRPRSGRERRSGQAITPKPTPKAAAPAGRCSGGRSRRGPARRRPSASASGATSSVAPGERSPLVVAGRPLGVVRATVQRSAVAAGAARRQRCRCLANIHSGGDRWKQAVCRGEKRTSRRRRSRTRPPGAQSAGHRPIPGRSGWRRSR